MQRFWFNNLLIGRSKRGSIFSFFLFCVGIALPFLLVTYLNYYYVDDVATFRGWTECLEKFDRQVYLKCQPNPPNYPVVGLFLSAGIIQAIKSIFDVTDGKSVDFIFRHYLAFFDCFNFILFIWLARLLRFRLPIFVGFILLIVPSTLVGGAIWGQIDGVSLSFCLLATISFFKSWLYKDVDIAWKSGLWLLFGTLNIVIFILIKQLSLFSLPFFVLLSLISGYKFWEFRYRGFVWVAIASILFILSFHYLDSLLAVPQRFNNSSFWFVLTGGGSQHAEKISGNGFNMWMLLGRNMLSSSRAPFPLLWDSKALNVAPYYAGMFLYGILMVFLLLSGFKISQQVLKWKADKHQQDNPEEFLLACLCFFFGLSQLGFNVLLTGTHERYLYLGYPFLLIAVTWFYVNKINFTWRSTLFCFFAASAYGCFVFAWMNAPLPGILFPMRRHEFIASLHLFLLLMLLEKWVQIWRYSQVTRKTKQALKVGI